MPNYDGLMTEYYNTPKEELYEVGDAQARADIAALASSIPVKVSDLQNDAGFITNTVNNLSNYYLKTDTYTQAEVNALISAVSTINILVVQILPTQNISTSTIYLLPKTTAQTDNIYDEYINITGTSTGWELIGDTSIDLSNYYTKAQVDSLLELKVDKVTGKGLSTEDYTTPEKTKLAGIAAGAEVNVQPDWNQNNNTSDDFIKNKPSIPTKVSDLINDSGYITGDKLDRVDGVASGSIKIQAKTSGDGDLTVVGNGTNNAVIGVKPSASNSGVIGFSTNGSGTNKEIFVYNSSGSRKSLVSVDNSNGLSGPLVNSHRPIQVNDSQVLGNNDTALNLKAGSNVSLSNSSGTVTIAATDTNTHRPIQVNGTQVLGNNTTALNLKAGSNVSLSNSSGTVTIAATNTVPTNYENKEPASKQVSSGSTPTNIASETFAAGVWLIEAGFIFSSSSGGYRACGISTTSQNLGGVVNSARCPPVTASNVSTILHVGTILNLSASTPVYFTAYHTDSNASLEISVRYRAIKIK